MSLRRCKVSMLSGQVLIAPGEEIHQVWPTGNIETSLPMSKGVSWSKTIRATLLSGRVSPTGVWEECWQ